MYQVTDTIWRHWMKQTRLTSIIWKIVHATCTMYVRCAFLCITNNNVKYLRKEEDVMHIIFILSFFEYVCKAFYNNDMQLKLNQGLLWKNAQFPTHISPSHTSNKRKTLIHVTYLQKNQGAFTNAYTLYPNTLSDVSTKMI